MKAQESPIPTTDAVTEHVGLLNVQRVAAMLQCSTRHVYRLAEADLMPRPYKLGSLVRWSRRAVEEWIERGCRPMHRGERTHSDGSESSVQARGA